MSNFDKFLSLNCVSILAKYWLLQYIMKLYFMASIFKAYKVGYLFFIRIGLLDGVERFHDSLLTLNYLYLQEFDSTIP